MTGAKVLDRAAAGKSSDTDVIGRGPERARAGPWREDRRVAYLVPLSDEPTLSAGFVRWAMAELAEQGFARVVTNALPVAEQAGFLAAGFEVRERLHVLGHNLGEVPTAPRVALRRVRRPDRPAVLAVDGRAFPPFWRLDQASLDEALGATPHTRFRLASVDGAVVGYALTGRAGRRGFLQRLAVDPAHRRRGLGRALVIDALRWLRRWHVERAVVNTPTGNQSALALYEGLGFSREPAGLCVLDATLDR